MKTHRYIALAASLSLFTIHYSLFAQSVPQPRLGNDDTALATTGTAVTTERQLPIQNPKSKIENPQDDVIEMSPFEVNSSKDEGYTAANTASGSRINTALKDTAAAISAFTPEFLQDVGAATVEDMLSYGSNIEGIGGDDLQGGFNPDSMAATSNDTNFRIRGMTMTTAMDGIETTFAQDAYNIDRAEISSGPNSILFGMGQPGGMVTLTSKSANLQRTTARITNVIGTWINLGNRWDYYRTTLDYNLPLMPRILGLRIMGMYQDGNNSSWRYWIKSVQKRINPALTIKPFQNTRINIAYETGRSKNSLATAWNAANRVSGWLDAGRPIQYTFNGANLVDAYGHTLTGKLVSGGGTPNYTFVDNNQTMYDFRQILQTIQPYVGSDGSYSQGRLPPEMSSYYYSTVGPGGWTDQRFDRYQFSIDQTIGNLSLRAGYYHNKNAANSHGIPNYDVGLRGDPNYFIPTPEWLGSSGAGTTVNPFVGRLYMEDNWEKREVLNRNDTFRISADYNLNLQQYGRHRLIGNLERAYVYAENERWGEILVDETQRAISNVGTPYGTSSANLVTRRHYVTEGDFATYYDSNWAVPIQPFKLNGHTYHSQYASRSRGHSKRQTDAISLTVQSYWFKDRLATILGGRYNDTFLQQGIFAKITDPADPRIVNRERVLNENVFTGNYNKGKHRRPVTYSAGAVWHITDRLSAFYNYGSNRADDAMSQTYINGEAEPSIGTTKDYGIMFDLSGNNRFFLRLTHFDTSQRNSRTANNNNKLTDASDRTQLIFDALYDSATTPAVLPRPRTYNSTLSDVASRGYEAELTARLSRSFTMRITCSYTDRNRENLGKELFEYYNANIPLWMNIADPAKNGGMSIPYIDPADGTPTTLYSYILQQLYTPGDGSSAAGVLGNSIRDSISMVLFDAAGGMSSRPLKVNVTLKYTFQKESVLKGTSIGGGARYVAPNKMPDPNKLNALFEPVTEADHPNDFRLDPAIFSSTDGMVNGNSLTFWDMFINHRRKISALGINTNMTLQLNLQNIFNQNVVTGARWNKDANGTVFMRRVYLNNPRSIRLTATFDF